MTMASIHPLVATCPDLGTSSTPLPETAPPSPVKADSWCLTNFSSGQVQAEHTFVWTIGQYKQRLETKSDASGKGRRVLSSVFTIRYCPVLTGGSQIRSQVDPYSFKLLAPVRVQIMWSNSNMIWNVIKILFKQRLSSTSKVVTCDRYEDLVVENKLNCYVTYVVVRDPGIGYYFIYHFWVRNLGFSIICTFYHD